MELVYFTTKFINVSDQRTTVFELTNVVKFYAYIPFFLDKIFCIANNFECQSNTMPPNITV